MPFAHTCGNTGCSFAAVPVVPRPADRQIAENPGGRAVARPPPTVTERPWGVWQNYGRNLYTTLAMQKTFLQANVKITGYTFEKQTDFDRAQRTSIDPHNYCDTA